MRTAFRFLKCRLTGYYKLITTGKCGTHLYYTGCGCKDCDAEYVRQKIEYDLEIIKEFNIATKSTI